MMNPVIEDALESIDMEYWLDREGVVYRRTMGSSGTQLNLKECPFCGGGNWKVYMNAETGLGNCFHGDCQTKFNKYSFIRAMLKDCSSYEINSHIEAVAEEIGWRRKPKKEKKVVLHTLSGGQKFEFPKMYDMGELLDSLGSQKMEADSIRYLLERGITEKSIRKYHFGDCVSGYYKYFNDAGGLSYQDYSSRIIIPIFDQNGYPASFQGRDYTGQSKKKYLFPPGINATGTLFYNGWNADECDQLIVGEGVFDCIAIDQAIEGDNAFRKICPVASFGKHISLGDSNSQLGYLLKLKEKGLKVITLMWDGEKQAIKDAINTALALLKYGFVMRVAILPKDKDPNEIPPEEIKKAFWEAKTILPTIAMKLLLTLR